MQNISSVSNYFQFYNPPMLDEYHRIREEASAIIHEELMLPVQDLRIRNELSEAFLYSVRLNVLNIVVEYHFAQYFSTPFYQKILFFFEAGHFPCGWRGDGPQGWLVVL